MERVVLTSVLTNKGKIGFYHGNNFELKEDM